MASDDRLLPNGRRTVRRARGGQWSRQRPIAPTYSRLKLRQAREEAGLSLEQAGRRLKLGASFIRERELGNREIYPEHVELFAKLYGKPKKFFLRRVSQ